MSVRSTTEQFARIAVAVAIVSAPLMVGACSMDTRSAVISTQERVELQRTSKTLRVPVADLDDAALWGIADGYRRAGEGGVFVTVTYDPKSRTNTAMKASGEAGRVTEFLRKKAGASVESNIMPVVQSGQVSELLITYDSYSAYAPQNCKTMGGLEGTETHADEDYRYGCTIESNLARQIANPKDLKGQAGLGATSGRRLSNIVEGYKTGEPNAALNGESASQ